MLWSCRLRAYPAGQWPIDCLGLERLLSQICIRRIDVISLLVTQSSHMLPQRMPEDTDVKGKESKSKQ